MLRASKIKSSQSIFDLANISMGGFDKIMTLIQLNPEFESINVNLDNFVAKSFTYEDSYYKSSASQLELKAPKAKSVENTITGKEGQTIYDLVIMGTGNLDNLMAIIKANGSIFELNTPTVTLKQCKFDTSKIADSSVVSQIKSKGYILSADSKEIISDPYRITDDLITRITDGSDIRKV